MAEEEARVDLITFKCKECYVYREVSLQVVTWDEDCSVRLYDKGSGDLFAECPLPQPPAPLTTAVEPVVDSSRFFVLRLVDPSSGRHAFIGIGFAQRSQASDFNAALYEHLQYLRRKREAEAMAKKFGSGQEGTDGAAPGPFVDYSLKPGEKIVIKKLAQTGLTTGDSGESKPLKLRGAKLKAPIDLFSSEAAFARPTAAASPQSTTPQTTTGGRSTRDGDGDPGSGGPSSDSLRRVSNPLEDGPTSSSQWLASPSGTSSSGVRVEDQQPSSPHQAVQHNSAAAHMKRNPEKVVHDPAAEQAQHAEADDKTATDQAATVNQSVPQQGSDVEGWSSFVG